jgi:ABC-type glycerol-3-phosphate transport system substrate-binding protein
MLRLLALAAVACAALAACGGGSDADEAEPEAAAATATAAAQATAEATAGQSTTPGDGAQATDATAAGDGDQPDVATGAVGPLTPGVRRTQAPPADVTPVPSSERPPPNDDDLFAEVTDAGVEGGQAYFILYAENKSEYWAVCDLVLWVNYTDEDATGRARIDSSDVNFGRLEPGEGREQGPSTGPATDVIDYAVAADWQWC